MDRVVIRPYIGGSQGARNLANEIHAVRIREGGTYRPLNRDLIVNWGNPRRPGWWNRIPNGHSLNSPEAVARAINKISTFRALREAGIQIPDFATTRQAAAALFTREGTRVLCRTAITAHSGRGIQIATNQRELVAAPLYVKYVPKREEYRLHVLNGEVIDIEQKRRRNGVEQDQEERLVRSHRNGWIFARNNVTAPNAAVRTAAIGAVRALGLDFGAVDLGYHPTHGVRVYEVNTAPGIEGTTVERYAVALRRLLLPTREERRVPVGVNRGIRRARN